MYNMQLIRDLEAVRDLIKNERNWTKGCEFKIASRWFGLWWENQYCVIGAMKTVCFNTYDYRYYHTYDEMRRLNDLYTLVQENVPKTEKCHYLFQFNDSTKTSHKDVIALLDRIIVEEKEKIAW